MPVPAPCPPERLGTSASTLGDKPSTIAAWLNVEDAGGIVCRASEPFHAWHVERSRGNLIPPHVPAWRCTSSEHLQIGPGADDLDLPAHLFRLDRVLAA